MFDIKQSMFDINQSMFDAKQSMLDFVKTLDSRKYLMKLISRNFLSVSSESDDDDLEYADSSSDESEIAEIAEEMSVQDFSIARGLTFKDLFPVDTYNTTCKEPTDDDMETVSEKSVLPTATVWKCHDFSIAQILREINFGDSRIAKSAVSKHSEAQKVDFYEFLHFLKAEIDQIN